MSNIVRHKSNPFLDDINIQLSKKNVKLSALGKDNNVLVNTDTGETQGTHVVTYKKVDSSKFVKLFASNIALTFDLNAASIKSFNVLIYIVQNTAMNKDLILLDKYSLQDFIDHHSDRDPPLNLSMATFRRGLVGLEDAGIIAKSIRLGWFYINPSMLFNGDRIAFTTLIERDRSLDNKINN